jgi:hypothetical protein
MTENKNITKPEEFTIKELVSNLKVRQLWAVIGTLIALLVGSFEIGYKINQSSNEQRLGQLEELTKKIKLLNDKERFLSLYLRFELAKEKINDKDLNKIDWSDYDKERKAFDEYWKALKAFDDYINEHVDKEKLIIHKGEHNLASIEFSDGTSWTIPEELHSVEKK